MKMTIDLETILAPIAGENPAGENLRYMPEYDGIKEARRADDTLDRGDWQRDLKTSDWNKVISISLQALTEKSKDLQIAVWLTEALAKTDGFAGVAAGLKMLSGLLNTFWEDLYPEIDDDDLDYRISPLEFGNEKISFAIREIPLTDPGVSQGYSLLHYEEGQQISQANQQTRETLIADGKISPEEFDTGVRKSSLLFYEQLHENIQECLQDFAAFDEIVDEKFGREAPRLSEIKTSLEDVNRQVIRFLKDKGGLTKKEEAAAQKKAAAEQPQAASPTAPEKTKQPAAQSAASAAPLRAPEPVSTVIKQTTFTPFQVSRLLGSGGKEDSIWQEALHQLKSAGIEASLEMLLGAACSAQSLREKTNCRMLTAKICLRSGRADLAWPIAEELYKTVADLNLERWESPTWVAEVYGCLYECLTGDENAADEDKNRANELLVKICTLDITMAMKYAE